MPPPNILLTYNEILFSFPLFFFFFLIPYSYQHQDSRNRHSFVLLISLMNFLFLFFHFIIIFITLKCTIKAITFIHTPQHFVHPMWNTFFFSTLILNSVTAIPPLRPLTHLSMTPLHLFNPNHWFLILIFMSFLNNI